MDWMTVFVATASSTLVSGTVALVVKRTLTKSVDLLYEKFLEESRAEILEDARRRSLKFDQELEAVKQVTGVVYRLRAALREHKRELECLRTDSVRFVQFYKISQLRVQLFELMSDFRAIMPQDVFSLAHSIKLSVDEFSMDLRVTEAYFDELRLLEDIVNGKVVAKDRLYTKAEQQKTSATEQLERKRSERDAKVDHLISSYSQILERVEPMYTRLIEIATKFSNASE